MALDASGKRLPWFKMWTRDFMADPGVQSLNWEQRGRFCWALMCSWESDRPGVALDTDWQRWMGMHPDGEMIEEQWEPYQRLFKPHPEYGPDVLVQSKLAREYEISREERGRKSTAGRVGAQARWQDRCGGNATALRSQSDGNGNSDVRSQKSEEPTSPPTPPSPVGSVLELIPSREKRTKTTRADWKDLHLPDVIGRDTWSDWCDHRLTLPRSVWTKRAAELSIAALLELDALGYPPKAVIERSILNGWKGLFKLDSKPAANGSDGSHGW